MHTLRLLFSYISFYYYMQMLKGRKVITYDMWGEKQGFVRDISLENVHNYIFSMENFSFLKYNVPRNEIEARVEIKPVKLVSL